MRLLTLPGVFRPRSDSWMLAEEVAAAAEPGDRVVDVCTGSGVIAVSAALAGADVTAIDVSRRAVVVAGLNAKLNGVVVDARRGDLLAPLRGERVDLIASNPPYVPGAETPARGAARAWEGGRDGRRFLDRLIADAPRHLRPGGALLVVHSSICGVEETQERMADAGLEPSVVRSERGPLGPIVRARLPELRAEGRIAGDADEEDVVLIRAALPA
jgi:release factor glutamine methyltransferase